MVNKINLVFIFLANTCLKSLKHKYNLKPEIVLLTIVIRIFIWITSFFLLIYYFHKLIIFFIIHNLQYFMFFKYLLLTL